MAEKTKSKETTTDKKPNAITRWWRETIVRWWRETMGELRKVTWPTRKEAQRLTLIVLAVMAGMSALLGILDWVFSKLITLVVA